MKPEIIVKEHETIFTKALEEQGHDIFKVAKALEIFRTTLTSLIEQEIAWVEGSKEEISKKHPNWDGKIGYTQACDDIIEHLKELLK